MIDGHDSVDEGTTMHILTTLMNLVGYKQE